MGNSSKRDARALTARARRIQVVELRCKLGLTLQEIADRIGVHKSRVGAILDEVKSEMSAEAGETYRAWVMHGAAKDEARRLRMWRTIEERVEFGDLEAIAVGVKLVDQGEKLRAGVRRMFGLDAPQRAEVTGKDGGPIRFEDIRSMTNEQLAELAAGAWPAPASPDGGGGIGAPTEADDCGPDGLCADSEPALDSASALGADCEGAGEGSDGAGEVSVEHAAAARQDISD